MHKLFSFKLLLLPGLVVLLSACGQTPSKPESSIDYAKYAQQEAPLSTDLGDKDEYEFALDLVKLAIERKHYGVAESRLQKLRKVNNEDIRLYRMLSQVYEAQGKNGMALIAMQQSQKLKDKTVDDDSELARFALMEESYAQAEQIYQAWLTSTDSSRQVSGLNNLGFSALLQKKYPLAKEYFQQALQKDPLNAKARSNLQLLKTIAE